MTGKPARTVLALALLATCARNAVPVLEKLGDSGISQHADTGVSSEGSDNGDTGDGPDGPDPWETGCVETGIGFDGCGTMGLEDTGWYADLPVYECPDPPDDAIVIDLQSANADAEYSVDPHLVGWLAIIDGANWADDCLFDRSPMDDRVDGAATLKAYITMPVGDPISYQGEWDWAEGEAEGGVWVPEAHAFSMHAGVVMEGEADGRYSPSTTGGVTRSATLCLSRVRPHRLSGTYYHEYIAEEKPKFFFTFDVDAREAYKPNPNYGCFASWYDYVCPTEIWRDAYESTLTDTGAR